jgi:hypothetical protein
MSEQPEISIDDELLDLAPDPAPTPAPKKPSKPKNAKKGPGRPPKKQSAKDKEPVYETEIEPEGEMPAASHVDDEFQLRVVLCEKINGMKKRLGAMGSGLTPNPDVHSIAVLEREVTLMNQEIDCRRGEKTIRMFTIQLIAPFLTRIADIVGAAAVREGKEKPVDLTGLDNVLRENWEDMLAEPVAQIAINNPQYFAAGPYAQYFEGLFAACGTAHMMNEKKRADAKAERAKARLEEED